MHHVREAKRIVVKVGSSTLTHEGGRLNFRRIDALARVISDLSNGGREIILVSSGAQAAGVARLGLESKPSDMPGRQAVASVGQCRLMHIYDKSFSEYGHNVAQILLTRDITDTPSRLENVKNAFDSLIRMGVIPIVNENDAVAVEEISIGDNDTLSAVVASICGAELLVILSDIDGLYDNDPRKDAGAQLIPVVYEMTDKIRAAAGGAGSERGTGGMATKIHAADICGAHGIPLIIASGDNPDLLYDICDGKSVGTLFLP